MSPFQSSMDIHVLVNGEEIQATVPANLTAADFLRERCRLVGTKLGCEHGVCGACTVHVDGVAVRSCILLAVGLDGATVTTVEGIGELPDLHPVQEGLGRNGGLQCGFCTPGMIMTAIDVLTRKRDMDEETVRAEMSGNICRCTGYVGIVDAVLEADREWER